MKARRRRPRMRAIRGEDDIVAHCISPDGVRKYIELRGRLQGSHLGCNIAEYQGMFNINEPVDCLLVRLAAGNVPWIPFATYVIASLSEDPGFSGNDPAKLEWFKAQGWKIIAKMPAAHREDTVVNLLGAPTIDLAQFKELEEKLQNG